MNIQKLLRYTISFIKLKYWDHLLVDSACQPGSCVTWYITYMGLDTIRYEIEALSFIMQGKKFPLFSRWGMKYKSLILNDGTWAPDWLFLLLPRRHANLTYSINQSIIFHFVAFYVMNSQDSLTTYSHYRLKYWRSEH